MPAGQWATAVPPRPSSSSIFISDDAPATRLSSSPEAAPPLPTSESPNSDVVVSALLPSFVCVAMLPFCFLVFGFALLVLVHRQQRHLQEVLTMKLVKPPVESLPARIGRTKAKSNAICRSSSATDSSRSERAEIQENRAGKFDAVNDDFLSFSTLALIGSSTSSSISYLVSEKSSLSDGDFAPPDAVPHFNTPDLSSSYQSEYSRSFTSSSSSSSSPEHSVTSRLISVSVHRFSGARDDQLPPRVPGPPSARRNLYDSLGRRPNTVGGYGTALWSLVTSSLATASASVDGAAPIRLNGVVGSVDSLSSAVALGIGGNASVSLEWDAYLPNNADYGHFGSPLELSETEHWV